MASGASRVHAGSMTRFDVLPADLPAREGVGPSCVGVAGGSWLTVVDFLVERFPRIARGEWLKRMQAGLVFNAQGEQLAPEAPFKPHTKLYYYRSLLDEPRIPFDERVVYRDEHIVVADKPHFLPVTPSGRYLQETLLVRLKRRLKIDTLAPVHRIDRETAGLVLFTIRTEERGLYQAMFRERRVDKRYEAIAPVKQGMPLPTVHRSRMEQGDSFMTMREAPGEPNSETRIELLESMGSLGRYDLRPLSGKRHQLRVHMAALGCPILGDRIYPNLLPVSAPDDTSAPLQLLAKSLAFVDPVSQEQRSFTSGRVLVPCG